jgi:hypothetical protein
MINVEEFLVGFVTGSSGTTAIGTSGICIQSIKDTIDATFNLLEY